MHFYWRQTIAASSIIMSKEVQDEFKAAREQLESVTGAIQTALELDVVAPTADISPNAAGPQPKVSSSSSVVDVAVKREVPEEQPQELFHTVFSTDCSPFQDWQTLLVFHSAKAAGQQGPITRIASGCDDAKKEALRALYGKLHPEYHVHFTPDFKLDKRTGKKYDFYNKPYGLLHWLENADPPIKSGTVIGLIDPDMIFLRPLTARVKGDPQVLYTPPVTAEHLFDYAGKGRPVAQQYGLGAPWTKKENIKLNRTAICGLGSPCMKVPDERTGAMQYSVGPPYILERDDFLRLAKTWVEYVPRVYETYPHLLAEMYAYSLGAAHEELPHLRLDHYMVSNIHASDEGWPWIDALPNSCVAPVKGIFFPGKKLPTFVHYCQFYRAKEIGFQKRRVYNNIFSCEREMLLDLPEELSSSDYLIRDGKVGFVKIFSDLLALDLSHGYIYMYGSVLCHRLLLQYEKVGPRVAKRTSFILCSIHQALNAALMHFKSVMCQGNPKTNYNRTFNVVLNY
jgi:hypothetical protein